MHIKKLQNSDTEKLGQFLSAHIKTSMFLYSNMLRAGLEYQGKEYQGDYFGAFHSIGNIKGVLAHYWNGNIMMQAQDVAILKSLARTFQTHVARPIAGILGNDAQA